MPGAPQPRARAATVAIARYALTWLRLILK